MSHSNIKKIYSQLVFCNPNMAGEIQDFLIGLYIIVKIIVMCYKLSNPKITLRSLSIIDWGSWFSPVFQLLGCQVQRTVRLTGLRSSY